MEIVCSICGISGKMRPVSEVISPKGLILACEKCALEEGFPRVKKPDKKMLEQLERRKNTVYETMSRLSGVRRKEPEQPQRYELIRQEESLRKIVDRNYGEKMRRQELILKSRSDLIDNFHWIIMRVRRVRGLTQKQLAEAIGEPEPAIKMAEQGVVPEGYGFIEKIQRFLNVRLIKQRTSAILDQSKEINFYKDSSINRKQETISSQPQTQIQKTLSFDRQNLGYLTIADLRRMRQEREMEETFEEKQEEGEIINEEIDEEKET